MLRFLRLLRWRLPPPLTSAHRCGPIGLPRRGQRAGDLTVADQLAGIRPMASTNAPKAVQIALGVLAEEAARQSFRVPRCTRVHVSCRRTCRGDHVRLCAPGPLKASELTLQPRGSSARRREPRMDVFARRLRDVAKGSATLRAFGLIGVRPRIDETLRAFLFSGPSWSPRGSPHEINLYCGFIIHVGRRDSGYQLRSNHHGSSWNDHNPAAAGPIREWPSGARGHAGRSNRVHAKRCR